MANRWNSGLTPAAILGPRELDRLTWAEPLARTVWGLGLLLLLAGMALVPGRAPPASTAAPTGPLLPGS